MKHIFTAIFSAQFLLTSVVLASGEGMGNFLELLEEEQEKPQTTGRQQQNTIQGTIQQAQNQVLQSFRAQRKLGQQEAYFQQYDLDTSFEMRVPKAQQESFCQTQSHQNTSVKKEEEKKKDEGEENLSDDEDIQLQSQIQILNAMQQDSLMKPSKGQQPGREKNYEKLKKKIQKDLENQESVD